MRRFLAPLILLALTPLSVAKVGSKAQLAQIAENVVSKTKLTLPGSTPFHLKAAFIETTNPDSDYKGEVEEYWVAPDKWKRMIKSPEFSQTLIVNGDKVSEEDTGDYFPLWLRTLVIGLVDPLPSLDRLKKVNLEIAVPGGPVNSCGRLEEKSGSPPAENSVFSVICFESGDGLIESEVSPGFHLQLHDYKKFGEKQIARRIITVPESGTDIEAKITELTELQNPDEALFAIINTTPANGIIKSLRITEATALTLFSETPDIQWPSVRSGKTSGLVSIYISIDRKGHVREAEELNSDNGDVADEVRKQVMKWKFKTATMSGVPVQIESVLTFAFNTKIEDAIAILSDEEARKQAINIVEPTFPAGSPSGTEVKVRVGVTQDGKVNGVGNPFNVANPLFMAAYAAVSKWRFRPYLHNDKPDTFSADVVFRVP